VLQTKIDYKQAIKLSDAPTGRMWMQSLEPLRWTVQAAIAVNGNVAALGEQVGIFIDLRSHRPLRMPAPLKQMYHELTEQQSTLIDANSPQILV
jgi:acyl-CoA thioester hydrolase